MAMTPEDTPIHRVTINEMSLEQLDAELEALRIRRMNLSARLVSISQTKRTQQVAYATVKFDKGVEKVKRMLEKLSEATLKVEAEMNKMRALALEIEDLS